MPNTEPKYTRQKLIHLTPEMRAELTDRSKERDLSANEYVRIALEIIMDVTDSVDRAPKNVREELLSRPLRNVVSDAMELYVSQLTEMIGSNASPAQILEKIHLLSKPRQSK